MRGEISNPMVTKKCVSKVLRSLRSNCLKHSYTSVLLHVDISMIESYIGQVVSFKELAGNDHADCRSIERQVDVGKRLGVSPQALQ